MKISFDIPSAVENSIAQSGGDPAVEIKEAALVELYRMGRISHGQFAEGLGISRYEADCVLRRHNVTEDLLTREDLAEQVETLRKLAG